MKLMKNRQWLCQNDLSVFFQHLYLLAGIGSYESDPIFASILLPYDSDNW